MDEPKVKLFGDWQIVLLVELAQSRVQPIHKLVTVHDEDPLRE